MSDRASSARRRLRSRSCSQRRSSPTSRRRPWTRARRRRRRPPPARRGRTVDVDHVHGHVHERSESRRALAIALALTASYTVVEVVGGIYTGSLALLADAVHMLSDNLAIAVALAAAWLAARPATPGRSFGYKRAEVLAALANGVLLVALAIWIFVAAAQRLADPPDVLGGWMLVIAVVGIAMNLAAGGVLYRSRAESINV